MESIDHKGRTPLFYAVAKDDLARMHLLINDGANINARDRNGETPLHLAAREFRILAAGLLLVSGADVDAQDVNGNTPLYHAVFAYHGHGEMIRQLIAAGASKTKRNRYGVSPGELALRLTDSTVRNHMG